MSMIANKYEMTEYSKDSPPAILPTFDFLYKDPKPFKAFAAARELGKTFSVVQWLFNRTLSISLPNSLAYFFSGKLDVCRTTVTSVLRKLEQAWDKDVYRFNSQTNSFHLPEGKIIKLMSYEMSEDSFRGSRAHTIVLDECASMPEGMFGVLLPCMLNQPNHMAQMVCTGTISGRNKFWDLLETAIKNPDDPDWSGRILRASKYKDMYMSGHLERMRRNLSHAEYMQEFECDPDASCIVGSVYGDYLKTFTDKNISDEYNVDATRPVYAAWDIGYSDNTSIWFYQVLGNQITFVDFYESSGYNTPHYANEVLAKPFKVAKHYLPHDSANKNINDPLGFAESLSRFGLSVERLPRSGLHEGINACKSMLKTARFNKTACARGIDHIRQYCYKYNYKLGVDRQQIKHDIHSHAADALRYACLANKITSHQPEGFFNEYCQVSINA